MMTTKRLALYTTVYPGVEKFLPAWYQSVKEQTDKNFDIWIGVDDLYVNEVANRFDTSLPIRWVKTVKGATPAQIRQNSIKLLVDKYEAIVFVDSDDILEPTRISGARDTLAESDVSGCAMRIVNEEGCDMGYLFESPPGHPADLLARSNIYGLSNSAYRTSTLRKCLPIPTGCILVDWFLATGAWVIDARFVFDPVARMRYRQHSNNIARVIPPFTEQQVLESTRLVLGHYSLVLSGISNIPLGKEHLLSSAKANIEKFYSSIQYSYDVLKRYVYRLNQMPPRHIWWSCVAHPELEDIWKN